MRRNLQAFGRMLALLAFLAGVFAALPAAAQTAAEMQCRATCAAGPREDRARLLMCLQRCGVAVQQANARPNAPTQPRLVQGSGYGRPVSGAALPVAMVTPAQPAAAPGNPRAASQSAINWGAIYAAPAPFAGLGVVTGQRDRLQAHGRAETACAARANGLPCRMLVEFSSGCAAAARAERGDRVAYTAAETGQTRAAAEHAALGACQSRIREGSCRVVQTVCAG
jgi:hypothetical protein